MHQLNSASKANQQNVFLTLPINKLIGEIRICRFLSTIGKVDGQPKKPFKNDSRFSLAKFS